MNFPFGFEANKFYAHKLKLERWKKGKTSLTIFSFFTIIFHWTLSFWAVFKASADDYATCHCESSLSGSDFSSKLSFYSTFQSLFSVLCADRTLQAEHKFHFTERKTMWNWNFHCKRREKLWKFSSLGSQFFLLFSFLVECVRECPDYEWTQNS